MTLARMYIAITLIGFLAALLLTVGCNPGIAKSVKRVRRAANLSSDNIIIACLSGRGASVAELERIGVYSSASVSRDWYSSRPIS